MLKKSLIPAALIALSSVSAFADSESSFYLGAKGLYFMPKDEISKDFESSTIQKLGSANAKFVQSGGIFLPGLQFGYNVSDSIRVGLAGYFGASKFKYTSKDMTGTLGAANLEVAKKIFGNTTIVHTDTISDVKIELGPRFVALATMDMKVFESDSFSLGFGIGAGAAKWKASITGKNAAVDLSNEVSKWKPAFMGTVNANVAIGDVAVLTGSVGYAHLGTPKGLKKDDKGDSLDLDANKAKGFIFGLGIGKEF
jgi:peptidoglycan hydrolase-like protein with peptidoglycan-binding domain